MQGFFNTGKSMWYTILTNWMIKTIWQSQQKQKRFWQNSTQISNQKKKNSLERGHRGNLPQNNKGHIQQNHSKRYSQWWKTESISSKIRNKTRVPIITTITLNSFGSPSHDNNRRNKRNPNWKRRSKTVTVYRWHDTRHITRKLPEFIDKFE